jgi:hypothetical protein
MSIAIVTVSADITTMRNTGMIVAITTMAITITEITIMAIVTINRVGSGGDAWRRSHCGAFAVLVIALLLAPLVRAHAADTAPSAETSSNSWHAFGSAVKHDATRAGTAIKLGAHRVAVASKSAAHEVAAGFKRAVSKTRASFHGQPSNGSASS